ncbi:chromatin assembly factor 1 subunit FSM-like [Panicum miliaceum]|uniref:Chromatin assembly factor 1 subunit FSM-like n=1 Tax=Panicum miliaceum TaxID=4540 RepID=A0A3L6T6W9_PANMI|nr:chromatin assembly factor 1 subunit FSM-like [Panicum miliaceum]
MDGDEAKESALDCAPNAATAMCPDASCEHESAQSAKKQQKRKRASSELDIVDKESSSAEWRRELDALYEYYKEVSGHHVNPEELACLTGDSIIACLLEESSLPCAKLTEKIYKRFKLQDGVTVSSVRNSVLNIGRRSSYGVCAIDVDELEDESDSNLWCWETQDLALLPSHLHNGLSIRRTARKLIHERILALSGKLAAKDTPNTHSNQDSHSVNAVEVPNLDEICSFVEKSKQKNDADITKMHSKAKAQELQATRKAMKEQQMMARQIENEEKKKYVKLGLIDRELKHMKEKADREAKRIERDNKQLKKHQEEAERAKKRKEKEEAELKRKASTKKQANFMEGLFIKKPNSIMESSSSHHLEKTACSKSSESVEEPSIAATSAMDCRLSQANHLRVEEFWVAHVSRWRKLSQCNRLHHWGVRRSPKVQLFPELKLQKSSAIAHSDNMSTPTKEQSSQESTGNLDFSKLLDELKTPSREKNIPFRIAQNSISSSVLFVKKLLQFDKSFRPAYYGTWRKKSSTVSARQPFRRDPELNYDVDSDEEWEEEDPGETLSDSEEEDKTKNEHDSMIDVEEETENSFVVPNDYLSEDEGVQYEPVCVKFDDTCSMLSNPGVTVEQKFLHSATEDALRIDRPLVISNLDHRKLDLLKAEDITAEKLCLQALCMKKYPSGPIIDVPMVVKVTIEDPAFCRSNKKSPRTPVPTKSISDSDMPEFAKLVTSCSQGMGKLVELLHERFPCVSRTQLKNKVREIAEFIHNRWQIKLEATDVQGRTPPNSACHLMNQEGQANLLPIPP